MDTRKTLLAVAVVVLTVGAVAVAATPGALDDPRADDEPDHPGHLSLAEVIVTPGEVRGETAELQLLTDLEHRGGTVENVSVRYRAVDAESGLLVDETTVDVGDVDVGDDDPRGAAGETGVNGSLDVERAGGYEIETVVFASDERRTETTTRVSGVSALTPSYADSPVGFTDGSVWPTVAVSVQESGEETTTLQVSASVTNRGDERSEPLDLRVLLRQADANVVADEAAESVDPIRPGRTDTVTATVEVPAEYNYYVDAALWSDDVLIDETGSVANLNPTETVSANETVEDVEFEVGDFAEESADEPPRPPAEEEAADTTGDDTPGFGPVVALAALLTTALLARRAR
ncbi:PGF-CTERM sorting domain-containing protein [Halorubrum gandharaense]